MTSPRQTAPCASSTENSESALCANQAVQNR